MFADFYILPEQASTAAERHDRLFWTWVAISGFLAVLIAVLVIYFSIKYRWRSDADRPRPITGSLRLELFWSIVPLWIMVGMFAWGASVYFYMASPPADAQEIYVVGRQWMWKVQHPGGQREINELHVPVNEPVKLTLTSEDVIHDFFVPAFRIKVDVLPGRYTHTWFNATKVGRYHLFCAQYCGTDHSRMVGTVVVMERDEYQRWLRGALRDQVEGSMALEGRKLFLKLQCVACHGRETQRAPLLE